MPANTVKVDRSTKWGNPFVPGQPAPSGAERGQPVTDRTHAFRLYRDWARTNSELARSARDELAGRNLACWCPPGDDRDQCHAAVLIELANARG